MKIIVDKTDFKNVCRYYSMAVGIINGECSVTITRFPWAEE